MHYRAVIFDLDGTLLDTLHDLAASMNRVLERFGFPGHPPESYKYFVGDGIVNLARRALPPEHRLDATVAQAAAAFRQEYGRAWQQQTKPYPGIPELLEKLGALGLKLGVLTNKPDDLAKSIIAAYFPTIDFTEVAGARASQPLKPDPAGAAAMARRFALPPARIVLVGDSGNDMQTAVAAGIFAAGALWGFRTAAELQAAGAQFLLPTPMALLAWLT